MIIRNNCHKDPGHENIIIFDGICNLCNGSVKFIIKRDQRAKFRFVAFQSTKGQELLIENGLPTDNIDTMIFIKNGICLLKSTAGLEILKDLGWPWKLLYIFIFIPKPVRDLFYDLIAKSRYKIFGKRGSCMVPTKEYKNRFIV
nr:thiol-disulfide oxidoreductase DCC family protein [Bacteroidota bacterium]